MLKHHRVAYVLEYPYDPEAPYPEGWFKTSDGYENCRWLHNKRQAFRLFEKLPVGSTLTVLSRHTTLIRKRVRKYDGWRGRKIYTKVR